jgi:hypothetical protein
MVKLTPNLNPRGWDEMFSKDGVELHQITNIRKFESWNIK